MPTVSICIPTYNAARFLAETLESAMAQTFDDIEVLVVDDGSTDETMAIAESYALRDARIRIHRNTTNQGLPGNWDRARELACGDWIIFLFQDDLFAPDYVERMVSAARGLSTPLICCRRIVSFSSEVADDERATFLAYTKTHDIATLFPGMDFIPAHQFSEQVARTPLSNFVGEPSCVMLHRSALAEFGRFNTHMVQLVDFEYWARIATVRGLAYVDAPLVTFRVHGKSATKSNAGKRVRRDRLDSLVLLHEFLHAPLYRSLRASLRNRMLLWGHYFERVAQFQRTDEARDAKDPGWEFALEAYPPLGDRSVIARVGEYLYRGGRSLRRLGSGSR